MEAFTIKEALNYAAACVAVVLGWEINRHNDTKETISDFKEKVARECVTRDDLKDFMDRTSDILDRIFEKLDDKADKRK